jgi:crotonobetainyl-CoA:carnitine CoA-transferase CaiB-like acyl-CoA transferase
MTSAQAAADEDTERRGPLDGIRVIEWSVWQQGPVAGAMLGDLGAEVIKLEEPVYGDGGRAVTALGGAATSVYFETNNRNKRSITVNVKHPGGVDLVHRLVAKSDVFITNFRPGVPETVGLDYETLRRVNPRLIYGEASAFGSRGPDRGARGHDLLGMARSGAMLAGHGAEPRPALGGAADQMGASMLAYGVVAALLARERFGVGQKIESSLLGGMTWLQGFHVAMQLTQGAESVRLPRSRQVNPLYNWYRCADDEWLALATPQSDRHWPELITALGRPELAADPRFCDHAARTANAEQCVAILDEVFRSRPRAEWIKLLSGLTMPFAPVQALAEVVNDPQAVANDYVTEAELGTGPQRYLGFPVVLSETPLTISRRAPELGEHTEEVLIELLGLSWDDLTGLRDESVI